MATTLDPDALRAEVEAARAESQQGRPAAALSRYRSLRTRIERSADHRAEIGFQQVRVVLGLAAAEDELTGRLDAAMTLLDEAEALTGTTGAESRRASVRGQRGLLLPLALLPFFLRRPPPSTVTKLGQKPLTQE